MIFAAIADWADAGEFPVEFMCQQLGVSRSGYYAWRTRPVSHRKLTDIDLTSRIRRIHQQGRGNPGVRRVRAGLAAEGIRCGLARIHRLMQAAGLQGRHPKAWRRTTIAGAKPVSAPDLIGRNFTAPAPDKAWCGDITYVNVDRLGVRRNRDRPALPDGRRLGGRRPHAYQSGPRCPPDGPGPPSAAGRGDLPQRPRNPVYESGIR